MALIGYTTFVGNPGQFSYTGDAALAGDVLNPLNAIRASVMVHNGGTLGVSHVDSRYFRAGAGVEIDWLLISFKVIGGTAGDLPGYEVNPDPGLQGIYLLDNAGNPIYTAGDPIYLGPAFGGSYVDPMWQQMLFLFDQRYTIGGIHIRWATGGIVARGFVQGGKAWRFPEDIDVDWSVADDDRARVQESDGGQEYVQGRGASRRSVTFSLSTQSESLSIVPALEGIKRIQYAVGTRSPVLFVPRESGDIAREAYVFGRVQAWPSLDHVEGDLWRLEGITVREAL